ncbi:hypothetical protein [Lacipirellula parvula]|uniref:NolW-like domain-containing protein n=1 Tax=Lacipirellula parvula TaxID=2650471 RepID=A0A5K7XFG4_9BACT|nr:hypothetical protein [Lacipirellula parvula]BBO35135.1 hypothetical protein PLANPX_4747 [Lacipirellula parvula]
MYLESFNRCRLRLLIVGLACAATIGGDSACAQAARSGAGRAAQQLSQPVSLTWQEVPLATAIKRLAATQSIAVWLDRRIDPSTPINLTAADQPVSEVLDALSEQVGAAAVPFAGIVYVGPQQSADELTTLAELAREPLTKAPAAVRNAWLKPAPWSAPRLSQPRALLTQLAAEAEASALHADRIPHDLWPARELPTLAAIDRAVLLLAGFDLTCQLGVDGRQLDVVPIERPVAVSREYRIAPSRAAAFQEQLAQLPTAKASGDGSRQTVVARTEDHDLLRAALAGRPTGSAGATRAAPTRRPARSSSGSALDDRRFTLTIENKPLAAVLAQLASQLQLQIDWDAAIPETAEGRNVLVSCQVDKANLDDLLRALLNPAGFAHERSDAAISIRRQ